MMELFKRITKRIFKSIITVFFACVLIVAIGKTLGFDKDEKDENVDLSKTIWIDCNVEDVTFQIGSSWKPHEDQEGLYVAEGKYYFGLQGISELASYSPEEFYKELLDVYNSKTMILEKDETLKEFVAKDGTECLTATVKLMNSQSEYLLIDIIIAEDKNRVLTFVGQAKTDSENLPLVHTISESVTFNKGNEDYASGHRLVSDKNNELDLKSNGDFVYYNDTNNHEKEFATGTYEVYYGQEAVDKVASLKEYGLTNDELEEQIKYDMCGYALNGGSVKYHVSKDTFYCFIMHVEQLTNEPNDVEDSDNDVLFVGYYIDELELFHMLNCNVVEYCEFEYIE